MLSRVTPNGTSIKVVDNLVPSLRSLHWLLAVDAKAFMIVLNYHKKLKYKK